MCDGDERLDYFYLQWIEEKNRILVHKAAFTLFSFSVLSVNNRGTLLWIELHLKIEAGAKVWKSIIH